VLRSHVPLSKRVAVVALRHLADHGLGKFPAAVTGRQAGILFETMHSMHGMHGSHDHSNQTCLNFLLFLYLQHACAGAGVFSAVESSSLRMLTQMCASICILLCSVMHLYRHRCCALVELHPNPFAGT
jgi:hypothetical protein